MDRHVENEMKFTRKTSDSLYILSLILEYFENNSYTIMKQSEKRYADHYFDSNDYTMFKNKCSARVRDYGDRKIMTVKIPINNENGVTSRKEIEAECKNISELQPFLNSVYDENIVIEETVCLKTIRKNVHFKKDREFTLSVDSCSMISDKLTESFTEIEIESIDEGCIDEFGLNDLEKFIVEELQFKQICESKYSRALERKLSATDGSYPAR